MKPLRAAVVLAALTACVVPGIQSGTATAGTNGQVLYASGDQGYECFRIPALVRTGNGTLLAFAEARKASADGTFCSDSAPIDTVVRRSFDHGRHWSAPQIVLSGSPDGSDAGATRGNPEPICIERGRYKGRIVLLTTYNPAGGGERTPFVQYSDDDGKTWSAARSLKSEVDDPAWGWFATGPAHGIQLERGPHAGRLVAGVNYDDAAGLTHGALAYSDNGGESWQLGADAVAPMQNHQFGELSVFQAGDGTVTAIARNKIAGDMSGSRMAARSIDGGTTFTSAGFTPVPDLGNTPGVQGASLLALHRRAGDLVLFSSPVDPELRKNMTVFASDDSGATWPRSLQITSDRSGYSDLTLVTGGTVGLLYEAGSYPDGDARDEIRFDSLPLPDLAS